MNHTVYENMDETGNHYVKQKYQTKINNLSYGVYNLVGPTY